MGWVLGLDVSNHQTNVDWRSVAADGVKFAWAKVTEGTGYTDPFWAKNRDGARAVDLPIGGYHFARPSRNPARAEADYFLSKLGDTTLPPVLDYEDERVGGIAPAALTDWAMEWLERVHAGTGVRPVIYMGAFYGVARDHRWLDYDVWLPAYTAPSSVDPDPTQIKPPPSPAPWGRWDVWQYTSKGEIAGVTGWCDLNVTTPEWLAKVTGSTVEDDDMPLNDADKAWIADTISAATTPIWQQLTPRGGAPIRDVVEQTLNVATIAATHGPGGTVDTQALLDAIHALPEETVAAIKAAL